MEFRDVVKGRRMVRTFQSKPIPEDVLMRVLEVARHAPSAGFSQGFDFIVLKEPEELDWFYRTTNDPTDPDPFPGRIPESIPACIVLPFADKRAYLARYSQPDKIEFGMDREENWPVPFWTVDASMAIMLILLSAVNEGLGAWYLGITAGQDEMLRTLRVPAECDFLGVIAIGYPSAGDKPRPAVFAKRRRSVGSMFHFGRW